MRSSATADVVYYDYTSRIPGQTGEKTVSAAPYGHFGNEGLTHRARSTAW